MSEWLNGFNLEIYYLETSLLNWTIVSHVATYRNWENRLWDGEKRRILLPTRCGIYVPSDHKYIESATSNFCISDKHKMGSQHMVASAVCRYFSAFVIYKRLRYDAIGV